MSMASIENPAVSSGIEGIGRVDAVYRIGEETIPVHYYPDYDYAEPIGKATKRKRIKQGGTRLNTDENGRVYDPSPERSKAFRHNLVLDEQYAGLVYAAVRKAAYRVHNEKGSGWVSTIPDRAKRKGGGHRIRIHTDVLHDALQEANLALWETINSPNGDGLQIDARIKAASRGITLEQAYALSIYSVCFRATRKYFRNLWEQRKGNHSDNEAERAAKERKRRSERKGADVVRKMRIAEIAKRANDPRLTPKQREYYRQIMEGKKTTNIVKGGNSQRKIMDESKRIFAEYADMVND